MRFKGFKTGVKSLLRKIIDPIIDSFFEFDDYTDFEEEEDCDIEESGVKEKDINDRILEDLKSSESINVDVNHMSRFVTTDQFLKDISEQPTSLPSRQLKIKDIEL